MQYEYRVLYRDPLHDFAFVVLLTKDKSVPTDLPEEIVLAPNRAQPNTEIHRVSNESGLGGNIGQGYIGRTDCNPPALQKWSRDDINTDYIALSMVTQGGSSGSLAVDCEGYGVALTCSSNLLNCFMLPVNLPLRALEKLRNDEPVTRGTLQVKWGLKALNDCKTCGLSEDWFTKFEEANVKVLVCAQVVLHDGPADGKVEVGDMLLELDGQLVTSMLQVEEHMDDHVHETAKLKCWGPNGVAEHECTIEDLHALTPTRLYIRSGAVFHNLAFATAVRFNRPVSGVLVGTDSKPPFRGLMLLDSIGGIPIKDTEQLAEVLDDVIRKTQNGWVTIKQKALFHQEHAEPKEGYLLGPTGEVSCAFERRPAQGGPWVLTHIAPPNVVPSPFANPGKQARPQEEPGGEEGDLGDRLSYLQPADLATRPEVARVFSSFVPFGSHRNISLDGHITTIEAVGMIVHVELGLAVAFRKGLTLLDEVALTVAGRERVRARVIFLHPAHNLAVLKFEPASVDKGLLRACCFPPTGDSPAGTGAKVFYVPMNILNRTVTETAIANLDEGKAEERDKIPSKFFPFRHMTCRLAHPPASDDKDAGVLLDEKGQIVALVNYAAERYYLPAHELRAAIRPFLDGAPDNRFFRDFDVVRVPLTTAVQAGLSETRLSHIRDTYLLAIDMVPVSLALPSKGDHPLRSGDIILEANDKVVTRVTDLGFQYENSVLRMVVLRDGVEVKFDVPLIAAADTNATRFLKFCGAVVHRPNLAARMQTKRVPSEVYVSSYANGSPANMYSLGPQVFITMVNNHKIETLDEFLERVQDIPYEQDIPMRIMYGYKNTESRITVKKTALFPTMQLHIDATGKFEMRICDEDAWDASLDQHAGIGPVPLGTGIVY